MVNAGLSCLVNTWLPEACNDLSGAPPDWDVPTKKAAGFPPPPCLIALVERSATQLHDRQVRTQGRSLGAEHSAGRGELGERGVGRAVVQEVRAAGQRSKAKAGRVESDATDVERGLGGFVEGQLEVVAKQQVDTV